VAQIVRRRVYEHATAVITIAAGWIAQTESVCTKAVFILEAKRVRNEHKSRERRAYSRTKKRTLCI
jgi:hypothetical protein